MKRILLVFTLLCLITFPFLAKAAPSATINTRTRVGCDSVFAVFTLSSYTGCTGTVGTTQWYYIKDVTSGAPDTLAITNASYYNFNAPGTYSVVARIICGTDTGYVREDAMITVRSGFGVSFTTTNPGVDTLPRCAGTVNFRNTTAVDTGSCSFNWYWIISNSGGVIASINSYNASYNFTSNGTYAVSLIGFGPLCGCSGSITRTSYITIVSAPTAAFSVIGDSTFCSPPGTVCFRNASAGVATGYSWHFGDGAVVNRTDTASVCHTFASVGSYSDTLYAFLNATCSTRAVIANQVIISNFAAAMGAAPSVVCQGSAVTFSDSTYIGTATNYYFYVIDLATGRRIDSSIGSARPSFTFTAIGNFRILDSAVNAYGCSSTAFRDVRVLGRPTILGINATSIDSLYRCAPNRTVNFLSSISGGTGAYNYTWHWSTATAGDTVGGTGTSRSRPSHTYTASGVYSVMLHVSDVNGCVDSFTYTDMVTIQRARLRITLNTNTGCAPVAMTYRTGLTFPLGGTAIIDSVAYGDSTWCRGAGCDSGGHTYIDSGRFVMRVYWRLPASLGGCTYVDTAVITVGNVRPIYHVSQSPSDSVCPHTTVYFNDSCFNCTSHSWTIGYLGRGGTSDSMETSFTYDTLGFYRYQLIMSVNGCVDTVDSFVYVYGPGTGSVIVSTPSCTNRDSFIFTIRNPATGSLGIPGTSRYFWDFGVTTTDRDTSSGNPVRYTYPTGSGTYTAVVTYYGDASNHFCTNTDTIIVDKRVPTFNFTLSDSTICKNDNVRFVGPLNMDSTLAYLYTWVWGDRTPNGRTGVSITGSETNITSHTYTDTGTYRAYLILTNGYGCIDSAGSRRIRVYGPVGGFTASDTTICAFGSITFTDRNVSRGAVIVNRFWNLNSTGVTTAGAPPNTTFAGGLTATGVYPEGRYVVTLNDSDNIVGTTGSRCWSFDNLTINAVKPHARFTSPDSATTVCPGLPITFRSSNRGVSYRWNFGDGTGYTAASSSDSVVTHTYSANGTYSISLIVISDGSGGIPAGCADTLTRASFIRLDRVDISVVALGDTSAGCPPLSIFAYPTSSPFYTYTWKLYQGSRLDHSTTSFLYSRNITGAGSYRLVVTASTPRGCTDSTTRNYFVGGPSGYLVIDTTRGCAPVTMNVHFVDTGSTRSTGGFVWNSCPAGTVITTTPDLALTYTAPGVYCPPTVVIQSGSCVVPIVNLVDSIRVFRVPTITATLPDIICFGANTALLAGGANVGTDSGTYVWTPSTYLTCDTCQNPLVIRPLVNTTYVVTGTTIDGCSNTAATIVQVDSPFRVTITGKDTICIGARDTLRGYGMSAGFSNYIWSGTGSSVYVGNPNVVTPITTTTYKAKATNAAGCTDSAYFKVTVLMPPVLHVTPDPAHYCKNQSPLQLVATGASKYIWKPNLGLSCDSCRTPLCTIGSNIIYTMVGTDIHGCRDSFFVPVTVYDTTVTGIRQDTSVCIGTPVQMFATGGIAYKWDPSLGLSNPNIYNPIANPPVTTIYTVYITENVCFKDTLKVKINVVPTPIIKVPPSVTIIAGNSVQLYADTLNTVYITDYLWTPADSTLTCFDCPRPIASPVVNTTYTVKASTIEGCTGYASVTINVLCQSSQVFVPNTFTPNGDGVNDRFYISGKGLGTVKRLAVYSRWGQLVFESRDGRANDPSYGWDGTFNGEVLQPDVFIYVLDIECQTGEPFSFKGDISLVR